MKLEKLLLTTVAASTLASVVSVLPAQATNLFGTDGILFDTDTSVKFTFNESHGYYKSTIGVWEVGTENYTNLFSEQSRFDSGVDAYATDNLGTCGGVISSALCETTFLFEAGKEYALYIESTPDGHPDYPKLFSTTSLNDGNIFTQQAKFFQGTLELDTYRAGNYNDIRTADGYDPNNSIYGNLATNNSQSGDPFSGPVLIALEDSGNYGGHRDYNDFLMTAQAVPQASVPEPATLMGLGVIAGLMGLSRRRKESEVS